MCVVSYNIYNLHYIYTASLYQSWGVVACKALGAMGSGARGQGLEERGWGALYICIYI